MTLEERGHPGLVETLSAVPMFDLETADSLFQLSIEALEGVEQQAQVDQHLIDLISRGTVEVVGGLYRVARNIGDELRSQMIQSHANTYLVALDTFAGAAEGSMRLELSRVLGSRSALIVAQAARSIARPAESGEFDHLIDLVHRSARFGRSSDSIGAAQFFRTHSVAAGRELEFLEGLSKWQQGERLAASSNFMKVLEWNKTDKAAGIAAHLLGVHLHEIGDYSRAIELVEYAERALSQARDNRGLAITKTTHGRMLRDRYSRDGEAEDLELSLKLFGQAQRHLRNVDNTDEADRAQSLGRILIGRAQTKFLLGRAEDAIRDANESVHCFRPGSESSRWARLILAGLLRDKGDFEEALMVLENVESIYADPENWTLLGATELNVRASILRRVGRLTDSQSCARKSVEIGEYLGQSRHTALALLTLARTEVQLLPGLVTAGSPEDLSIRSLLARAEQVLLRLNDKSGVAQVREVRESLRYS